MWFELKVYMKIACRNIIVRAFNLKINLCLWADGSFKLMHFTESNKLILF